VLVPGSLQLSEGAQHPVPRERAQAHDYASARQKTQILDEERQARIALGRRRLVLRRHTADAKRDVAVAEHEAIVAGGSLGLVGKAGPMQRAIEPLS
jgi:hypothetical protein